MRLVYLTNIVSCKQIDIDNMRYIIVISVWISNKIISTSRRVAGYL